MAEPPSTLRDEIEIRKLIEAYSDAVFRRDAVSWGETWAEDATWSLMGHEVLGRSAILEAWKGAMSGFSFVGFFAYIGSLAISGDSAKARVYVQEVLVETSGKRRHVIGEYSDNFERRAGKWRFSRRNYRILNEG